MIKIPYADALKRIASGANLSEGDVEVKIKEKMGQLSGLISRMARRISSLTSLA